jgi:FkbM family methyltransferase
MTKTPIYALPLNISPESAQAAFKQICGPLAEGLVVVSGFPYPLLCRPDTSDIPVIFDTFGGLYHIPPVTLPQTAIIVDLGANIGCTMAHFAALYSQATITGVELDAENARLAVQNTQHFGQRCRVVEAAIWSHDGEVSYEGIAAWGLHVSAQGSRPTRALSMATLLASISTPQESTPQIDFLKIDIEGGERELFTGDCPWLQRIRSLKVEIHDLPELFQTLPALLKRHGFQVAKDTRHWSALCAWRAGS